MDFASGYDVSHSGATIASNGTSGWIGMYGMTCNFSISLGGIDEDVDLLDGTEILLSEGTDDDGVAALLAHKGDTVIRRRGWSQQSTDVVAGFITATFVDHGFAAVADDPDHGCTAQWWHNGSIDFAEEIPSSICEGSLDLTVDQEHERMYIAGGEVWSVDANGATHLDFAEGDLASWDAKAETLYVSSYGGKKVNAWTGNGMAQRWQRSVDGEVADLTHMGQKGGVLVATAGNDSRLLAFGGMRGVTWMSQPGPKVPVHLDAANNGRRILMTLPHQVGFYNLSVVE
jgi:hypothetical protein